jgi:hypothetical protein
MKELSEAGAVHCANCNTPMQGEFCHHCGQSIHSVIKPMHHMAEDVMDMVLHVDGRIVHTLPPLLLRPGFLTLEYFSGRRQRYVAPFRLMFVLCLLAFFAFHLAVGDITLVDNSVAVKTRAFEEAKSPSEVEQALQQQLAGLEQARRVTGGGAAVGSKLDAAKRQLVREAMQRRIELGDKTAVLPDQADAGAKPDTGPATEAQLRNPLDSRWDARKYPVGVNWLPDFINHWLQRSALHVHANLEAASGSGATSTEANERLVRQWFAALPQTMFVMLPLFALLLKLVYLFRRRLYMEHLIVALHSHAFMFLALLLGVLLQMLKGWLAPHAGWTAPPLHWLQWALALWVPTYLLIMQKRIYRQGWTITALKYLLVGWCYLWLLVVALLLAAALSLTH